MPNQEEISQLAQEKEPVEVLRERLQKLHRIVRKDVILYASSFIDSPVEASDEMLAINDKDIQHLMHAISEMGDGSAKKKKGGQAKRRNLDLILHSPGGAVAAAEQIVNYLRAKYTHIRVIVPQNAMSAATMIACAADEVMMGRHSALGPTDPQIPYRNTLVAAGSVINELLYAKNADLVILDILKERIKTWPPGFIDKCIKGMQLANTVVADWLCQYMKLNPDTAEDVAEKLADTDANFIHDRPFNYDKLEEWGLKVKRLEDSQTLQDAVLSVFHAATAVFDEGEVVKIVVNHHGKGTLA